MNRIAIPRARIISPLNSGSCSTNFDDKRSEWHENGAWQVLLHRSGPALILGVAVIIKLKDNGEVRAVIEEIAAPAFAENFQRSLDLTQWKVRLETGEVVTVPGSAFSRIEYAQL